MDVDVDVVVVGAGLSGIGAAYRLQTECPDRTFAVLEAREAMGGTWDLFRYPGVRSDSDMFTLGYEFKPWRAPKAIADGDTILDYIHETAAEFGIEQHIRYRTKVVGADWSSADARWTLRLETADGPEHDDVRLPLLLRRLLRLRPRAHPGVPGPRGLRGRGRAPAVLARGPGVRRPAGRGHRQRRDRRDARARDGRAGRARDHAPAQPHLDRRHPGARQAGRHAAREAAAEAGPPAHPHRRTSCSRWASTTSASASPTAPGRVLLGLDRQAAPRSRDGEGALHPVVRPVGPAVLRRTRRRPVPVPSGTATPRWSPTTSTRSCPRGSG